MRERLLALLLSCQWENRDGECPSCGRFSIDYGGGGRHASDCAIREMLDILRCDCVTAGNQAKPKQHGADPHAKNCAVYTET